jgi:hypothetical protein
MMPTAKDAVVAIGGAGFGGEGIEWVLSSLAMIMESIIIESADMTIIVVYLSKEKTLSLLSCQWWLQRFVSATDTDVSDLRFDGQR